MLDGLRGVAILLVFLGHAEGPGATWGLELPQVIPLWRVWLLGGQTGVSLFFVLSAFLLSQPFLAELDGGPRVDRLQYARRRVMRIMPAYGLAVLVSVLLTANTTSDLARALPYWCFLQAIPGLTTPIPSFSAVWWSLATEVQFYLVLPLLTILAAGPRRWVTALVLCGIYGLLIVQQWPAMHADTYLALAQSVVGRGPVFAAGIAAAIAQRRLPAAAHSPWGAVACLAAVGGLTALLQWELRRGYWAAEANHPEWHAIEGLLWAIVLLGLLHAPGWLQRCVDNRPLCFLGRISFSVYLVHLPIIDAIVPRLPGAIAPVMPHWSGEMVAATVVAGVASLALGWLGYSYIERPFLKHRRFG